MNREMRAVTLASGRSEEELRSLDRPWQLTMPRIVYCWLRRNLGMSLHQIGDEINRSHSTVVYYMRVYGGYEKYDAEFRQLTDKTKLIYDRLK